MFLQLPAIPQSPNAKQCRLFLKTTLSHYCVLQQTEKVIPKIEGKEFALCRQFHSQQALNIYFLFLQVEHIVKCQLHAYQEALCRIVAQASLEGGLKGVSMHNTLMELRKICNHPFISKLHVEASPYPIGGCRKFCACLPSKA